MNEVSVLALGVLVGFLAGFALHLYEMRRRPPEPVIVMLSEGSTLADAGVLLRKAADEAQRQGRQVEAGYICELNGVVIGGEGAVYTPRTTAKTAVARFARTADLCGELENIVRKQQGQDCDDQCKNRDGGGPEPLPVGQVEARKDMR